MSITTVKVSGEGYLVDGTMSVPKAEGNRHYREVQEWVAEGGVIEAEFTQAEIDSNATIQADAEARDYLRSTDWQVIRFLEAGVPVPGAITAARAAARLAVS